MQLTVPAHAVEALNAQKERLLLTCGGCSKSGLIFAIAVLSESFSLKSGLILFVPGTLAVYQIS